MATTTPSVVEVVEDLLTPDAGFAISEREVEDSEVGGSPRHLTDIVLGVVRDGSSTGSTRPRSTRWSRATACSTSARPSLPPDD
jgi:hypothetical protein